MISSQAASGIPYSTRMIFHAKGFCQQDETASGKCDILRYYGLYANANQGKVRKASLAVFPLRIIEEEPRRLRSFIANFSWTSVPHPIPLPGLFLSRRRSG